MSENLLSPDTPFDAQLLSCPFCGESRAKIMPRSCTGIAHYYQVECLECGAMSHGSFHLDKKGAAMEWNTRPGAAQPPGTIEKAKDALFNIARIHGYKLNDMELSESVRAVTRAIGWPGLAQSPASPDTGIDAHVLSLAAHLDRIADKHLGLTSDIHAVYEAAAILRAGDAQQPGLDAVHKALFEPPEADAIDNLEGALLDIKRLSEQGKPTDQDCIRTIERVQAQLLAAHAICEGNYIIAEAPAAQEPGWQPIETAPKDGEFIDVWFVLSPTHGARWASVRWSESGVWTNGPPSQHEGGWKPTHWMHKPDGPSPAGFCASNLVPSTEAPAARQPGLDRDKIARIIFGHACGISRWDDEFYREERDGCLETADALISELCASNRVPSTHCGMDDCPYPDCLVNGKCPSQPPVASTNKPGFFASLTPEQQKAALEYDGPENHGDPVFATPVSSTNNIKPDDIKWANEHLDKMLGPMSSTTCTCAALGKPNIPHARNCPSVSSYDRGGK